MKKQLKKREVYMEKLIQKTQEVADLMLKDYDNWTKRSAEANGWDYKSSEERGVTITLEEGRNFIKFVKTDGQSCVNGFVVKNPPKGIDNKTGKPFQVGDLLMAASWSAPAKNFARGNVFQPETLGKCIRWTGVL
jgi:hypothetical protein